MLGDAARLNASNPGAPVLQFQEATARAGTSNRKNTEAVQGIVDMAEGGDALIVH